MKLLTLRLDAIEVGERLRAVDESHARWIAESFAETGQISPIEVRPIGGAAGSGRYALVSGAHRLRAAAIAEMTTIAAVVFEGDGREAQLREIDENLRRYDLTALDRAVFYAVWRQVYDETHQVRGVGRPRNSDKFVQISPGFAAEASERLQVDERTVRRHLTRHKRICLLAPEIRHWLSLSRWANKPSDLDAFLRLSPERQRRVLEIERAAEARGGLRSIREAVREIEGTRRAERTVFSDFLSLWKRADAEERAAIRDFIAHDGNLRARRAAGTDAA